MGKRYGQLSIEERTMIQTQLEMGIKPAAIALGLNRSASTLSRELRRNHHVIGEQHARQFAPGDAIGDLHDFTPRTGQPAGDESAFHASGQIADQARQLRVARVAMDDGEIGRQPAQVQRLALKIGRRAQPGKNPETAHVEGTQHDCNRRFVVVLAAAGEHAYADGSGPMQDAGIGAEVRHHVRDFAGEIVSNVLSTLRSRSIASPINSLAASRLSRRLISETSDRRRSCSLPYAELV